MWSVKFPAPKEHLSFIEWLSVTRHVHRWRQSHIHSRPVLYPLALLQVLQRAMSHMEVTVLLPGLLVATDMGLGEV